MPEGERPNGVERGVDYVMSTEVRLSWTLGQWRQFFGFADMTPLIELASVAGDRVCLLMVDHHLRGMMVTPVEVDLVPSGELPTGVDKT